MDVLTIVGLTVLFFLAYKIGLYIDLRRLKEKKEEPAGGAGPDSDSESKP